MQGEGKSVPALLALIAICLMPAGCSKKAPPPPPKRYVRMEALLPLHPLWLQMAGIDSSAQAARTALNTVDTLTPSALTPPPLFRQPMGIPPSLEQVRRARMTQEARVRIAKITDRLRRRNGEILGAEKQTARRELAARIAQARYDSNARIPGILAQIAAPYDRKIYDLGFKEVAYRAQTRFTTGQVLADAQLQLNLVLKQKDELAAERDAKEAQARSREETQLLQQAGRWTREMSVRMAARGRELEAQVTSQILNEEGALLSQAEPIPPLGGLVKVNGVFQFPALPAATGPAGSAQIQKARLDVSAALKERLSGLAAERERELAVIRRDVLNAATVIVRERGWSFVPEGTRGASDATKEVGQVLQARWQR